MAGASNQSTTDANSYLTGAGHGSRTHHLIRTKDACSHAYSSSNFTFTYRDSNPQGPTLRDPTRLNTGRVCHFRHRDRARVIRLLVEPGVGIEPTKDCFAGSSLADCVSWHCFQLFASSWRFTFSVGTELSSDLSSASSLEFGPFGSLM